MQRLFTSSQESHVSLDLNEIFEVDNYKMETIDASDIPDSILSAMLIDDHGIFAQEIKEEIDIKTPSTPIRSNNPINVNVTENKKTATPRFRSVTKEKVDEIASKSVQKRTHKQTNWGVKVFTGEICFD